MLLSANTCVFSKICMAIVRFSTFIFERVSTIVGFLFPLCSFFVTRRLRRQGGRNKRGHPAPRQRTSSSALLLLTTQYQPALSACKMAKDFVLCTPNNGTSFSVF